MNRHPATIPTLTCLALLTIGLVLVPGTATAAEVNDISTCKTINSSNAPSDGVVNLTADITNSGASSCIDITVDNLVLNGQNHTVDGTVDVSKLLPNEKPRGINVANSSQTLTNVTIRNVTVTDWGKGIYIEDASESAIEDAYSNTSVIGVYVKNADNVTATNVTAGANDDEGIYVENGADLTVTDVTSDANGGRGIEFETVVDSRIENATLTNNYEGVRFDSTVDNTTLVNATVTGSDFRGVSLEGSNSTVTNSTIRNNQDDGVAVGGTNVTLSNSTLTGNGVGVLLTFATDSIVRNNTIRNNGYGIDGQGSTGNLVVNNTVNANNNEGINFIGSRNSDNTFRNNTITDNTGKGIVLNDGGSNLLTNNTVDNSGGTGIAVRSPDNVLRDNIVTNNSLGVVLSGDFFDASNVTLHNTTVRNNANGAVKFSGSLPDSSVENFDLGASTAAGTTIDIEGAGDVTVRRVSALPILPSDATAINRSVNATNSSTGAYLNVTFEYTDSDVSAVDESNLAVWKYNGTWTELGTGPGTNTSTNEIQYNITTVGSVFAPLATSDTTEGTDDDGGGGGDQTPGRAQLTGGQARVTFGAGSEVTSVAVGGIAQDGVLDVQRLGRPPDDVSYPGEVAVTSLDISAPDPESGAATVEVTLSSALLDRHVTPAQQLVLQRYDPETNAWELLPTTVDTSGSGATLTAETDEFSVFAVTERPANATATPTSTPTATPTMTPTTAVTTASAETTKTTSTAQATPAESATATQARTKSPTGTETTASDGPGFGALLAITVLFVAGFLVTWRNR